MRRTNLRGHALRGEGKPYEQSDEQPWVLAPCGDGRALCECGATSGHLYTNAARKRWHAAHKEQVRAMTAIEEGR